MTTIRIIFEPVDESIFKDFTVSMSLIFSLEDDIQDSLTDPELVTNLENMNQITHSDYEGEFTISYC